MEPSGLEGVGGPRWLPDSSQKRLFEELEDPELKNPVSIFENIEIFDIFEKRFPDPNPI